MDKLAYDLTQMCRRNRDGSATTQYQRSRNLRQISQELKQAGYRDMRARSLKPKHIEALVSSWRARDVGADRQKNLMSAVRWWAEKQGKASLVPSNDDLGIERRQTIPEISRAQTLDQEQVAAIPDEHVRASLELQRTFGLRREESIKIQPARADCGNTLEIHRTWAKGNRPRTLPIQTAEQRAALDNAYRVAGRGSLIPSNLSYAQQLARYNSSLDKVGLSKMHGLRHAYAQTRYQGLTGRPAPVAGGLSSKQLTPEQQNDDRQARLTISEELGHVRESITATYLGR